MQWAATAHVFTLDLMCFSHEESTCRDRKCIAKSDNGLNI